MDCREKAVIQTLEFVLHTLLVVQDVVLARILQNTANLGILFQEDQCFESDTELIFQRLVEVIQLFMTLFTYLLLHERFNFS